MASCIARFSEVGHLLMGVRGFGLALCAVLFLYSNPGATEEISREEFLHMKADFDFLSGLVDRIESGTVVADRSFYTYRDAYLAYVGHLHAEPYDLDRLSARLGGSRFVLYGDEHSNPQSQEGLIWIMKQMANGGGEERVLVIEWIEKKYQPFIDAYLAGEVSEPDLYREIHFASDWGFDWESHVRILRAARAEGFRVVAAENKISPTTDEPLPLRARDNHVVHSVRRIYAQSPSARVLVSYGEFHLVAQGELHLREKLNAAGLSPDLVFIPRAGNAYWDALERTLDPEKVQVLRFSDTEMFLNAGTVSRAWWALSYYFKQMGLSRQNMNLIRSHLTSDCARALVGVKADG